MEVITCWPRLRTKPRKPKVSNAIATRWRNCCGKLSDVPEAKGLIMENIEKENVKCLAGAVDLEDEDEQKHYQELDDYICAKIDKILHLIPEIVNLYSQTTKEVKNYQKLVVDYVIPPLKTRVILAIDKLMDIFYLAMSKLYTGTLLEAMFESYIVDIAGKRTYLYDLARICLTGQTVKITLYEDSETNMMIMEALKNKISSSSGLEPMICDDCSMEVHAPACMSRDYIQCAVYYVESHLKMLEERIRKVGKEACDRLKEAAKDPLLGLDGNDLVSNFHVTELIVDNVEYSKVFGKEVIGRLTNSL